LEEFVGVLGVSAGGFFSLSDLLAFAASSSGEANASVQATVTVSANIFEAVLLTARTP
jgi:hypothetical protein